MVRKILIGSSAVVAGRLACADAMPTTAELESVLAGAA